MHRSGRSATLDFQSYQSVFSADYWVGNIIGWELEMKSVVIEREKLLGVGTNSKLIDDYPRPIYWMHHMWIRLLLKAG